MKIDRIKEIIFKNELPKGLPPHIADILKQDKRPGAFRSIMINIATPKWNLKEGRRMGGKFNSIIIEEGILLEKSFNTHNWEPISEEEYYVDNQNGYNPRIFGGEFSMDHIYSSENLVIIKVTRAEAHCAWAENIDEVEDLDLDDIEDTENASISSSLMDEVIHRMDA